MLRSHVRAFSIASAARRHSGSSKPRPTASASSPSERSISPNAGNVRRGVIGWLRHVRSSVGGARAASGAVATTGIVS
jgi:hypothetical protein